MQTVSIFWINMFFSVLCMLLKAFVSYNIFGYLSLQGRHFLGVRFFILFYFMLAKAPCWNSKREKEIGQVKGSRGGDGRETRKCGIFFSPPHPSFPSFALAPTRRVAISTLPNVPLSENQSYNNTNVNKQQWIPLPSGSHSIESKKHSGSIWVDCLPN